MERSWESLPLLQPIKSSIEDLGYECMTPVQAACIPLMFKYKDVAAEAVTGSGKTIAFLVPVVQALLKRETPLKKHEIGAVIISPTRELATQTHEVLQFFLKHSNHLTSLAFVGGSNINSDLKKFNICGGHIIVTTPGRFEDLLARRIEDGPTMAGGLKALDILIMDEADRLLQLGFANSINTIISYLPKLRRTSIFSATQTKEVINLIRAGMRNPVQITVKDSETSNLRTPVSLQNFYMVCQPDEKMNALVSFLTQNRADKIMVFFSSCASVEYFSIVLNKILKKSKVISIHGKLKSNRFSIFNNFRKMESGVLLCTDVMCRGVDIPEVEWVFQFDTPSSAESFVHRCGRTARNGMEGKALLLLLPNELAYVDFIQLNQKVKLYPMKKQKNMPDMLQKMRNLQLGDREIMDKATRAYVSFIQSYTKHECSLIINVKNLNLALLANSFGLLALPRMPELKKQKKIGFEKHEIDLNSIKYKNKVKEEERQKNLAIYRETGEWPGSSKKRKYKKPEESWSNKKDAKEQKVVRKKKKEEKKAKMSCFTDEDLEDLGEDFKILKQYKKGKISELDFEKHFGCDDFN